MLYHKNGIIGDLSVVGLGCWNFGGQWANKVTKDNAIRIIRHAIDNGVNFVDVAESYGIPEGQCEMILGEALQDGYREKVFLISKIGWYGRRTKDHFSYVEGKLWRLAKKTFNVLYKFKDVDFYNRTPELLRLCGHACCGRLRTNNIDLLLCHDDKPKDAQSFITAFRTLRDEGFIRFFGISTNDIDHLQRFYKMSDGECAACECDYSLLNRNAEDAIFDFCTKHNISIFARSVLERGLLSGKYNEKTIFTEPSRISWNPGGRDRDDYIGKIQAVDRLKKMIAGNNLSKIAYQFAFSNPAHPSVVMGCTNIEQLESNLKAAESYIDFSLKDRLLKND